MTDLFEIIFIVLGVVFGCKLISFSSKRILFLMRLSTLKRECNAKIRLHSFLFRPMWIKPKGPDATVEIADTIYLIRLYSGAGKYHSVHFASEEYSCVYMRMRASARSPYGTGASSLAMSSGINLSAKVHRITPMEIPEQYKESKKKVVRVLLLNPAPSVLSYVSPEKTSIKIAFTGDEMHGQKVFTADSFMRYADRMKREDERLAKENPDEYEYFYN